MVVEALPSATFRVKISSEEQEVLGYPSGKMRMHYIRLLEGDRVRIEMSPKYDIEKGRITFRIK